MSSTNPSSFFSTPPFSGAVLLEAWDYGEDQPNDKTKNLRGQLYQHYDGSGFQQINIYDFKKNPLETKQQLLDDATISDADWSLSPSLSTEVFTSIITYDALNRPVTQTDHGGNVHEFTYDKGGFLKKVKLNTDEYVKDTHYDAKGQRKAIWYGNGTKTSYTYDEFTFRLRRLLTVDLNNNEILQDLNYWYDPIGNITETQDDAQQTLFFNNSVVSPTQKFVYDALYRLIEAKGRELIGTADFGTKDNWNDSSWKTSHKGNGSAVQNYTQKYVYDEVGNILELQHIAGTGSYTRIYEIDSSSNKLLSTEVGSNTYSYSHDARGNMTEMPHLSNMAWNLNNEMKGIVRGTNSTYYQYSGGERTRKFTDKGAIKEERIYLGNFEIYRKFDNGSLKVERTTVHIVDDTGRIAMLEKRTFGSAADDNDTEESLERYIYSNHLQSASLELDETGDIISYEEYYPYGTTSYQAMNATINAVSKRYRYTGKERDEESGLYYHGARYYVPWLARWTVVDPLESKYAGRASYCYSANNPVAYNDPDGMEEKKGNGIMIYDVAETAGKGIEPKRGGSLSEYPQSERQVLGGQFELSAVMETTDDGKKTIAGYYVYDKWLRGDLGGRLEKDEYTEPTLVISNQAVDLIKFKSDYETYGRAARMFYTFGKPPESLIKKLAGLEIGNVKLIWEGIKQENKEAWTNPVFLLGVATSATLGLTNQGGISGNASKGVSGNIVKAVPTVTEQAISLSQKLGKNSITLGTSTKQIRFDLMGKAHGDIPTPHLQVYKKNFVNGVQKSISRSSKDAIPMTQQEVRVIRKYIEKLNK